jgi:hypothetical protein
LPLQRIATSCAIIGEEKTYHIVQIIGGFHGQKMNILVAYPLFLRGINHAHFMPNLHRQFEVAVYSV